MNKDLSKVDFVKGNYVCANCKKEFNKYQSQITTKNPCCSYSCSNFYSKGNNPYTRTNEHRGRMSYVIKNSPNQGKQRKAITSYNKSKKGKSYEEFYGKSIAYSIKEKLSRCFLGKNNPNFIDGRSFFPYPLLFNKKLKLHIKELDKFVCSKCGLLEEDSKKRDSLGRGLTIHHIDFNKNNCSTKNLITTCRSCNAWSNFNRNESIVFYQKKVEERYVK